MYPLTHFCMYLLYLFNLFGAKVAEKLILQLEILSCGYDWKGHRLILGTGWTPREEPGAGPALSPSEARSDLFICRVGANCWLLWGQAGLCVLRKGPHARPAGLATAWLPGAWQQTPGAVWTCPGQQGAPTGGAVSGWLLCANWSSTQKRLLFKLKRLLCAKTTIHPLLFFCRKGSDASWLVWGKSSLQTLVRWHTLLPSPSMCSFGHEDVRIGRPGGNLWDHHASK